MIGVHGLIDREIRVIGRELFGQIPYSYRECLLREIGIGQLINI